MKNMSKVAFIVLGIIFTTLGVIGVLLPVMPGVIFFVGAAYFFSRSSEVMHSLLLNLPYVGESIRDWHNYGAMTFQTKLGVIIFFWSSVVSAFFIMKQNLAYPIVILNFAIIASIWIIAIDRKIKN